MMSDKFTVVCTNPPYMNKLEGQLKKIVIEEYNPYKGDLFSVFIYKNFDYCKPNGYSAFMTPFVWMFIKTYEQLREYIVGTKSITTLIQMEYSAFEEATVPICSFVLKNGKEKEKGLYIKLSDFKGGMEIQKQKVLEALEDKSCNYFYETSKEKFSKIPGSPIAYWVSENVISTFNSPSVANLSKPCKGIDTGENNTFLRLWFEVENEKISFPSIEPLETNVFSKYKWYPYNKGGAYRKWYGNNEYLINWGSDGSTLRAFKGSNLRNKDYYFKKGLTWSTITSGGLSLRYFDYGHLFDNGGCCLFAESHLLYILALLNGSVQKCIMSLSPTINSQPGEIGRIPLIIVEKEVENVEEIVKKNIKISKNDWDSFETSWDFEKHPLLNGLTVQSAFTDWKNDCENRFSQLKANEEELNRMFIEIYDLQDDISPEIEEKEVTVRKADLQRNIRSFISYAVGCMFGRYSLDVDGLAYAGGEWDDSKYVTFIPDKDNCIPITDEDYFGDDIVGRFVEFVKCVYGPQNLKENLDFIAKALGNKGNTSREIIRNYFLNDFFKDHCSTYSVTGSGKRPIYWLYDSGKQNGFKALVYMHRYTADTTGVVRVDYLHKMQKIYMSEIDRMKDLAENSNNAREIAQAEKRKEKLVKQLKETKEYDEKIAHLAISRIAIDLDDGVKVNYEKVQMGQDGKKLGILAKI